MRIEAGTDDTTQRRHDATTMRHDDADTATVQASRCSPQAPLTVAAGPQSLQPPWCPSQSLQPQVSLTGAAGPSSLQPPSPCSPQVPFTVASAPQPHGPPCSSSRDPRGWVRIAVEATTTRRSDDEAQRRRCGDDDATCSQPVWWVHRPGDVATKANR